MTNVIKHSETTTATVRLELDGEEQLCLTIRDDGVGFDPTVLRKISKGETVPGSTGIGIQNIRQRLFRFLGVTDGLRFESERGKGSKVTVEIPIKADEKRRVQND